MSRRVLASAVLVALSAACAGCTGSAGAPTTHASSSNPVKASPAGETSSPSPGSGPTAPTAPASTPLGAGERVWAAFSQRGLSHDAWWARLRPLLSDSARAVYVYDDPRKIPPMTITGKVHTAAKAPAEPRYTSEVVVPTSKGTFRLDLERHTLRSRWLLYAIKFPAGVQ